MNDLEFQISLPGKKVSVNPNALGCRDEKTHEWKNLIDIIKDPDHRFNLSEGNSTYEGRRKLRDKINKKLVDYFRYLKINLPKNYKFYKQIENEKNLGVFRFSFGKTMTEIQTEEEQRVAKLATEDLLKEMKKLSDCAFEESRGNDMFLVLFKEAQKREIPIETISEICHQGEIFPKKEEWNSMAQEDYRIRTFFQDEESENTREK